MRKITTLVAALLIAVATFAQAPQGFSYQAVVRDAQNAIVANQTVEVTVTILQGATADAAQAVFTEKHSAKTNANGLFTITIGSVNTSDFVKIDWGKGNSFLKTESAYGESTIQLMSVPYALYAEKAASIDAAQLAQTLNSNDVKAILNLGATTIVNNALAEANYATTSSVNSTVNNALANYATTENVNTTVNNALASYATTEKLKDTLSLYAKIEDLPEGVNLTGYAKTADVDATYAKKTDLNAKANTADLADVATSGDYNDLTNKPTIPTVPTNVSAFTNDANYLKTSDAANTYATKASLKTVATTGSYNDLTNKPTIPTVPDLSAYAQTANMPKTINVTVKMYEESTAQASAAGTTIKLFDKVFKSTGTTPQTIEVVYKMPAYSFVFLNTKRDDGYDYYKIKINDESYDSSDLTRSYMYFDNGFGDASSNYLSDRMFLMFKNQRSEKYEEKWIFALPGEDCTIDITTGRRTN